MNSTPKFLCPFPGDMSGAGCTYLTKNMPSLPLKHKLHPVQCCEIFLAAVISKICAKYGEDKVDSNSQF